MMNRLTAYIYVILALSVCHGCVNIGLDIPEPSPLVEYPVLLNISGSDDTKITNSENKLEWEEDDIIQITAVADGIEQKDTVAVTDLQCFSIDEDNRSRASFSGFISLRKAPRDCYFTYPSGAAMTVDPSTGLIKANYAQQDGSHEPFLYAKVAYPQNPEDGIDLTMNHLGAVLKLDVQVEGVENISFIGNNLERLSPVLVNPDNHTLESPTEAVKQITVNVRPKDQKTYLFVPPVNLEKGFSLICSKADGSYFIKSYSGNGENGGYDFSAESNRGTIIPLTIIGDFVDFSVKATGLEFCHTMKDSLLNGTSVTFKMNLTGGPNKLIEGWGADLYNSNGDRVRTVSYGEATDIENDKTEVTMGEVDDWTLLPADEYSFRPYYIMYGEKKALDTQQITIDDHGAYLTVEATTSYDQYINDKISEANSHAWDKIAGVTVRTNIHPGIIDAYEAKIYLGKNSSGADQYVSTQDKGELIRDDNNPGVASYGDLTALSWGECPLTAYLKCGNLELTASKDCHVTGLPCEVDFTKSNPFSGSRAWGKLGVAEYSDNRVTFKGLNSWGGDKNAAIISPSFYLPTSYVYVKTSVDACYKGDKYINIQACVQNSSSISYGDASIKVNVPDKKYGFYKDLSSKGYVDCATIFQITNDTPSLMYASAPAEGYNLAIYKIKIQYSSNQ